MAKIKLEREKCIGCGSCQAICSNYFELLEDGKSHIKGSTEENHIETLETDKLECSESAAEACPTQCIFIEK